MTNRHERHAFSKHEGDRDATAKAASQRARGGRSQERSRSRSRSGSRGRKGKKPGKGKGGGKAKGGFAKGGKARGGKAKGGKKDSDYYKQNWDHIHAALHGSGIEKILPKPKHGHVYNMLLSYVGGKYDFAHKHLHFKETEVQGDYGLPRKLHLPDGDRENQNAMILTANIAMKMIGSILNLINECKWDERRKTMKKVLDTAGIWPHMENKFTKDLMKEIMEVTDQAAPAETLKGMIMDLDINKYKLHYHLHMEVCAAQNNLQYLKALHDKVFSESFDFQKWVDDFFDKTKFPQTDNMGKTTNVAADAPDPTSQKQNLTPLSNQPPATTESTGLWKNKNFLDAYKKFFDGKKRSHNRPPQFQEWLLGTGVWYRNNKQITWKQSFAEGVIRYYYLEAWLSVQNTVLNLMHWFFQSMHLGPKVHFIMSTYKALILQIVNTDSFTNWKVFREILAFMTRLVHSLTKVESLEAELIAYMEAIVWHQESLKNHLQKLPEKFVKELDVQLQNQLTLVLTTDLVRNINSGNAKIDVTHFTYKCPSFRTEDAGLRNAILGEVHMRDLLVGWASAGAYAHFHHKFNCAYYDWGTGGGKMKTKEEYINHKMNTLSLPIPMRATNIYNQPSSSIATNQYVKYTSTHFSYDELHDVEGDDFHLPAWASDAQYHLKVSDNAVKAMIARRLVAQHTHLENQSKYGVNGKGVLALYHNLKSDIISHGSVGMNLASWQKHRSTPAAAAGAVEEMEEADEEPAKNGESIEDKAETDAQQAKRLEEQRLVEQQAAGAAAAAGAAGMDDDSAAAASVPAAAATDAAAF